MNRTDCCESKNRSKHICPQCGNAGKPVSVVTLENLLKDPSRAQSGPYWFCSSADCPVVYFSADVQDHMVKSDLKIRVGIKETEDPIPLCYCFGWDRKRIWEEIGKTGKSTAVESITREVKAGNCFCERSNPQGSCCLGNIAKHMASYGK